VGEEKGPAAKPDEAAALGGPPVAETAKTGEAAAEEKK
jgi:hypothetical protein